MNRKTELSTSCHVYAAFEDLGFSSMGQRLHLRREWFNIDPFIGCIKDNLQHWLHQILIASRIRQCTQYFWRSSDPGGKRSSGSRYAVSITMCEFMINSDSEEIFDICGSTLPSTVASDLLVGETGGRIDIMIGNDYSLLTVSIYHFICCHHFNSHFCYYPCRQRAIM